MFEHDPLSTLLLVLTGFQVFALLVAWCVASRRADRTAVDAAGFPAWFLRLAERRGLSIGVVFAAALALSALLAAAHWPVPRIQDDFSYRLAGETFASGRMANPPHPMWPHFETEHVLQRPTYASKYPPMQGLTLAAGEVLAGEPMVGVWLGLGAACAAVCWMFYGFLPARWALAGGLVVATHPWILAWWGHSAWGGQMAMLGGALLYGGVKRIVDAADGREGRPRAADAVIMAIGLVLLANTRPYEGLAASLPAGVYLAWRLVGPHRPRFLATASRVVLPAAAVLALTGAAMTTYNQRVTGDPLRLPYQLHSDTYSATPLFVWQEMPPEPEYRDRKLRDFHAGWERGIALDQRTPYKAAQKLLHKLIQFSGFYLGPALGMGLMGVLLSRATRNRVQGESDAGRGWVPLAGIAVAWTLAASLLCVWFNPHYVAPVAPLVLLLAVEGIRRWSGSAGRGPIIVRTLALAHAATAAALFIAAPLVYPTNDWSHARARMIAGLTADGGEHLVLLRHGREYSPHEEWVYNAADIDASPVVWARELDRASARDLRAYYPDRRHWLLQTYRAASPDGTPAPVPELVPYPDLPDWLEAPPRRFLTGEAVGAVAAADIDGDGTPEVIAAPAGRPVLVVIRLNDGAEPAVIDLPAPATSLLAFTDRSGAQGIAATLAGRPELVIVYPAGNAAARVVPVPLRGEGRGITVIPGEDLLAIVCGSPAGVELIRMGDAAASASWHPVGTEPRGVAAADLTGDGVTDLAVSDHAAGTVWLFTGQDAGEEWALGEPAHIADVPGALGVTAADVHGDGRMSLAVTGTAMDTVSTLTWIERGKCAVEAFNTGVNPIAVAATDVDGDGLADLAVATRHSHGLTVLRNLGGPAGAAAFAAPAEVTLGTETWFVEKASHLVASDVDGDGVRDIVVGAADGVYIFLSGRVAR